MGFKTLSVAAASLVMAATTYASCPDVVEIPSTSSSWDTWKMVDPGNGSPVSVTFEVGQVGSGTTVEVFNGSWSAVSASSNAVGTRVRVTAGGAAGVDYIANDGCGDEIMTFPD